MRPQNYKLEFEGKNIDAQGITGYLEDNYLHTSTLLDLNNKSDISFTVNADAASFAADRFRIVFTQNIVLPIGINIVSATRTNEKNVTIIWKAENQTNVQSYIIERSFDGIHFDDFKKLNVTNSNLYTQIDTAPFDGVIYYRIKAISNNAKEEFSNTVKVGDVNVKAGFSIYPNPVTQKNIQLKCFNIATGKYELKLINSNGQIIYNKTLKIANNFSTENIPLKSSISAGAYSIKITAANGNVTLLPIIIL